MPEHKRPQPEHRPHGLRDRDSAADRPQKRKDYAAGANGEVGIDASATEAHETSRPDRDGSDGTGW